MPATVVDLVFDGEAPEEGSTFQLEYDLDNSSWEITMKNFAGSGTKWSGSTKMDGGKIMLEGENTELVGRMGRKMPPRSFAYDPSKGTVYDEEGEEYAKKA
uniref:Uncharacterized protein n=1 Tax=Chromera velia CCMP2878 TaxID=1169474 RepID=A0A0G4HWA8_9ALVE|mmetsp:Transcript_1138/g.2391  ORF Transcript_1138/g.2391 Transcript_1138/m.2391 type:complete len:101 (-) Transcript_1138:294-596(-)|eukprot:Cvel_9008.t1-p1 / transcript=Cvel_9008.t1 / gene=Cvel_9008 / organism=Chromera_velia_CCMP2878 / gene_product=hypothetical protein / transcript_product=hypothetical protein / location=Cvel_scaffold510:3606-4402(+) / protein_length=100 / sequence_SO=supercontig / SO=protein_coding / is_pseudo=false